MTRLVQGNGEGKKVGSEAQAESGKKSEAAGPAWWGGESVGRELGLAHEACKGLPLVIFIMVTFFNSCLMWFVGQSINIFKQQFI